ncbi:hypothetical protein [Microbispora sp. KK1-11]|uniref:hypothetical protein n=1 Tax=Microbispora sp. KK1-11 TaxID=2053005 RepID=UPI001157D1F3|nr:hypothetical protein [Microbispora sp. KK1-11]TQS25243.1 hypothetical protein FLW16_31185 [Microbispora sp. KK1-11]
MTASSPTPGPDPDHTRPMSPRLSAGRREDPRAYRPPGPPHEPVLPAPGQERGVFREEALRRHAVRDRGAKVPIVLRGPSFPLLWITVAVLAVAGTVVAVLVSVQMSGVAR